MRLTALKQADRFLPAGSFRNNESNLFRHPAKSETIFSAVVFSGAMPIPVTSISNSRRAADAVYWLFLSDNYTKKGEKLSREVDVRVCVYVIGLYW